MDTEQDTLLAIGAFARAAGLSLKALRLYDRLGLLPAAHTDPDSGYRYYRQDQVPAARLIRLMRSMDMPLALVKAVLTRRPDAAAAVVRDYRRAREQHLVQVHAAANELLRFLSKEKKMTFDVETMELPAMQVVSITQKVKVDALGKFITDSLLRISAYVLAEQGTLNGTPFGIYHGPVNQTDDGPLEVCFPASGPLQERGDIALKSLPQGQAAMVSVTGEQCQFPEILGAYDAAHDWIIAQGFEPVGPPREVWSGPDAYGLMRIVWPFSEKVQTV